MNLHMFTYYIILITLLYYSVSHVNEACALKRLGSFSCAPSLLPLLMEDVRTFYFCLLFFLVLPNFRGIFWSRIPVPLFPFIRRRFVSPSPSAVSSPLDVEIKSPKSNLSADV